VVDNYDAPHDSLHISKAMGTPNFVPDSLRTLGLADKSIEGRAPGYSRPCHMWNGCCRNGHGIFRLFKCKKNKDEEDED